MMFPSVSALIFFLSRKLGLSCSSSKENLKNVKLDVGATKRSLPRARNSGRCELLPLLLLGVSSSIQQWCPIMYIKYFIP